jgi:hypothetical protein
VNKLFSVADAEGVASGSGWRYQPAAARGGRAAAKRFCHNCGAALSPPGAAPRPPCRVWCALVADAVSAARTGAKFCASCGTAAAAPPEAEVGRQYADRVRVGAAVAHDFMGRFPKGA